MTVKAVLTVLARSRMDPSSVEAATEIAHTDLAAGWAFGTFADSEIVVDSSPSQYLVVELGVGDQQAFVLKARAVQVWAEAEEPLAALRRSQKPHVWVQLEQSDPQH